MKREFEVRNVCERFGMTPDEREAIAMIDDATERNKLKKKGIMKKVKQWKQEKIDKDSFIRGVGSFNYKKPLRSALIKLIMVLRGYKKTEEYFDRTFRVLTKLMTDKQYRDEMYNLYITKVLPYLK